METCSRIFSVLVLFSAISLSVVRCAPAQNMTAQYLIEKGISEINQGYEKDAVCHFRKVLLVDPNNGEALYYLNQLGASVDAFSDSPMKKRAIMNQANQALAEYQQEVAKLDMELNRMLFRLEQVQYENEQDPASHLNDQKFLEVAKAIFHSDTDQIPRTSEDVNSVDRDREHVRQAVLDSGSNIEFDIPIMLDDQPPATYSDQPDGQDKVVQILDDYLSVREAELQSAKNDLILTEIDLSSTQKDLAEQIDATQQLNTVYAQVLKKGDGHAFYVTEENSYMQFLEHKLDDSQDRLTDKSSLVKEQAVLLACLQAELEQSRQDISRLLEEREQLLNQTVYEVNALRKQDAPK